MRLGDIEQRRKPVALKRRPPTDVSTRSREIIDYRARSCLDRNDFDPEGNLRWEIKAKEDLTFLGTLDPYVGDEDGIRGKLECSIKFEEILWGLEKLRPWSK